MTLKFQDVYENRQRQGIGGGGDEDQIPGDPIVLSRAASTRELGQL